MIEFPNSISPLNCETAAPVAKPAASGGMRGKRARRAFTLIELLIVVAIMAILAALIFPVTGAINRRKMISRTRAELGLLKMAIDNYQSKLGFYPPDNTNSFALNQLYFELMGTTNTSKELVTLDGSARIRRADLASDFTQAFGLGVQGVANCSATGAGEEGRTAQRFLRSDLKPGQVASLLNFPGVKLLTCSIPGPYPIVSPSGSPLVPANANPFRYNSSSPTNNPNSYDLWVDIVIAGKTNRINNWSSEPIIVATP